MKTLYTAEALATGAGRDGHGRTSDGRLDLDLAIPVEMGGNGQGTNPEQLFAVGYAACFHSALHAVARRTGADVRDSSVGSRVRIGPNDAGGYQLAVDLEVTLPHLDHGAAQSLADQAHKVCPYSNATRGNIEVTVTVSDD
ncbi:organic hydroperoxide resistance protein [Phycicoccus elongatus]|jgi:Ohr subfamily peroxiredoxin|uniref:organic hydroperoxide resistance protein n=1 Tax=Phycicoccus elongatus TaxID=101689 RepID=UPI002B9BE2D5|nr:organic hydroperoxide resistance protein [Phycicoccus elongatus]HRC18574.1 organic hydroperoxide resistance protein [Phycicoccus elongatus]